MSEIAIESRTKSRTGLRIAGFILLFLYVCLFVFIGMFVANEVSTKNQPYPTITPTVAVTPQILVNPPDQLWRIRKDDFSSNIREWSILFYKGKIELIDGKLILQGYFPDQFVIGSSSSLFLPTVDKYYAQADFSTDIETFTSYGLVFGLDYSLGSFYLFEINQQTNTVRLYRQTSGQWNEFAAVEDAPLSPYPEATTLSVFMDNGKIDLYVNGEMVSTYVDENPLQSTNFGVFASGNEARVIIDNFFIYDAE